MQTKYISIALGLILASNLTFAQGEIKTPFMLDSVNNKGEKFSASSLLKTPDVKVLSNSSIYKSITPKQEITLMSPRKGNFATQTYIYTFSVADFTTTTLNLYSTDRVKISLNGKEISEKTSTENELSDKPSLTKELNLEPNTYTLAFSVLVSSENNAHSLHFNFADSTFLPNTKTPYGLTLSKMLEGRNIYSTEISPNGNYALAKYYDLTPEGKMNYGYSTYKKDNENLTEVFSSSSYQNVHWLDDTDSLYYVEDKNNSRTLYFLSPEGAKRVYAENLPEGDVSFLKGNRKYIILTQTSKTDKSEANLYHYQLPDDRIPQWRNRTNLVLYDLETQREQPLTFGSHNVYLLDYNAKTNKILFMVSYDSITVRPFSFNSIYQMNLATLDVDTLINKDGFVSSAQYIPNTDNIILTASGEAFSRLGTTLKKSIIPNSFNYLLFVMNTNTKNLSCITKGFNPSVKSVQVTDNGRLFLLADNKDSVSLYEYNFTEKKIKQIDLSCDIIHSFSYDKNGENLAFVGERYNNFPFLAMRTQADNTLAITNAKTTDNISLGQMRDWSFSYKGTKIDGRLYLPYDFDSTKTYPLIVYYYGGTEPTDRSFQMRYSAYLYTAQGYAVYVINPSGTIGWGEEFAARHVNTWGDRTVDEIIYGTKLLCSNNSFLDRKHIGCIGASYGGFMTMLLQTKTDLFACAISHAGISNIASYWGEGYWGYSYSSCATADSYPWNRKDIYVDKSPLFNANKIKTPLLLLQGTVDTNVPIGESIQMYNALKILGKDVEYITIKGENHGIVDYAKRTAWQNVIFAYFAKYLKGNSNWWINCTKDL